MWRGDDDELGTVFPLPAGARRSLRAGRRSPELRAVLAVAGAGSGCVALFATIAAAGLSEKTVFFCLFSVPAATTAGLLWASAYIDRLASRR